MIETVYVLSDIEEVSANGFLHIKDPDTQKSDPFQV